MIEIITTIVVVYFVSFIVRLAFASVGKYCKPADFADTSNLADDDDDETYLFSIHNRLTFRGQLEPWDKP